MDKTLLIKYISGQTSEVESYEVLEWINASKENEKYFVQMMNLWISQNMPNDKASDKEVNEMMGLLKRDKSADNIEKRKKSTLFAWSGWGVAASLLIGVLIGMWLYGDREQIVEREYAAYDYAISKMMYTTKGVKGRVVLPDSSVVWLNSDSRLFYPESFTEEVRQIVLSGEAFFDITKDTLRPMIVRTSKAFKVEVLGTTFNLKSYENDNRAEVTLYTGAINLILDNPNGGTPEVRSMRPNQTITIGEPLTKSANEPKDPKVYSAWKDGKIIFDDTPMSEVVKVLNRWHGVEFEIKDKEMLEYKITARFNSESITQIMDLLRLTSYIDYDIKDKTVSIRKR